MRKGFFNISKCEGLQPSATPASAGLALLGHNVRN